MTDSNDSPEPARKSGGGSQPADQRHYVAGSPSGPVPPPVVEPPAHDIAEFRGLRRRELDPISERLGRFRKMPWARLWGAVSSLLIGGAVGGAVAAVQMDAETDKALYWGVVGAAFIIGLLAAAAAFTTNDERADSVGCIKEDLDRLLASDDDEST